MSLNETQFKGMNVNNPAPLSMGFHGTKADISGDIKPSASTGADAAGIALTDKTYFTPLEEEAWGYASGTGRGRGRPRVYQTAPVGHQSLDTNHANSRPTVPIGKNLEWPESYTEQTAPRTVDSQKITDTHWTPTPRHKGGWVQGTLPHINWHEFNTPNWVQYNAEGEAHDDFGQRIEPATAQTDGGTPKMDTPRSFKDTPLPGFESTTPKSAPTLSHMPL
jgi:hypothetical protein